MRNYLIDMLPQSLLTYNISAVIVIYTIIILLMVKLVLCMIFFWSFGL